MKYSRVTRHGQTLNFNDCMHDCMIELFTHQPKNSHYLLGKTENVDNNNKKKKIFQFDSFINIDRTKKVLRYYSQLAYRHIQKTRLTINHCTR